MEALRSDGHSVYRATNDADTMIVSCALERCQEDPTDVASDLLNVIRCKCSSSSCSSSSCSCRKYGVSCVSACLYCRGENCGNAKEQVVEETVDPDDAEFDGNIFDIFDK